MQKKKIRHCSILSWMVPMVLFLCACQTTKTDLHPLTVELMSSGITFSADTGGQDGFDSYANSPGDKAFAASVGKDGRLTAWGKA